MLSPQLRETPRAGIFRGHGYNQRWVFVRPLDDRVIRREHGDLYLVTHLTQALRQKKLRRSR